MQYWNCISDCLTIKKPRVSKVLEFYGHLSFPFPIFILFEFVSKYLLHTLKWLLISVYTLRISFYDFSEITNIWQTILHRYIGKSLISEWCIILNFKKNSYFWWYFHISTLVLNLNSDLNNQMLNQKVFSRSLSFWASSSKKKHIYYKI